MRRHTDVKEFDGGDLDSVWQRRSNQRAGTPTTPDLLGTITVLNNDQLGQAANYGIGQTRTGQAGVNAIARRRLAAIDDEGQNL